MNCPVCGHVVLDGKSYCTSCGQDMVVYRRFYRLSNQYYNKGLEHAKVRNLSGAVVMLNKSLEMNKRNTNARNLLGLVLYEMGEVVAALSEWIISKHFQEEDNIADYYIQQLQSNPTNFENLNQTIKKYNQALYAAKQNNMDLAILQLKKVISTNPHYIRALQLLALLYMKNGENEKARKCLTKAIKIDVANVTTLAYLEEINSNSANHIVQNEEDTEREEKTTTHQPVLPVDSYKEDKPNYIAFVTFFAGVLLGIAVLYALVIPNIRDNFTNEYNAKERDYASVISVHNATIASLESERVSLEKQIAELEKEVKKKEDTKKYNELLAVATEYLTYQEQILLAQEEGTLLEQTETYLPFVEHLKTMELSFAENEIAMQLYETIKMKVYAVWGTAYYEYGHELYLDGDYEEALPNLEQAYEYYSENSELLYFLGRTYHRLRMYEQAKPIYALLLEKYPESNRYNDVESYLDAID